MVNGDDEGENFHTTVGYAYNERGWTTSASSPHFGYQLNYNDPTEGATAQYNGNISEQHWTRQGQSAKYFTYGYDKLKRLKDGNSANGNMREQLDYDDMGNITLLKRDDHTTGTIYSYTGNRLKSLSGAITTVQDYDYDANGNARPYGHGLYLQLSEPAKICHEWYCYSQLPVRCIGYQTAPDVDTEWTAGLRGRYRVR